jgi:hypothetical protein
VPYVDLGLSIGLPIGLLIVVFLLLWFYRRFRPCASSRVMPALPVAMEKTSKVEEGGKGDARVSRRLSSMFGNAAALTGTAVLASIRKVQARARGAIARQHPAEIRQRQQEEERQLAAALLIQAAGRGLIARSASGSAYKMLRARLLWKRARCLTAPSRRPPRLLIGASSRHQVPYFVSSHTSSRGVVSTAASSRRRSSIAPSRDAPVIATPRGASSERRASTTSSRRSTIARHAPVMGPDERRLSLSSSERRASTTSSRRSTIARHAPVMGPDERRLSLCRLGNVTSTLPLPRLSELNAAERYHRRIGGRPYNQRPPDAEMYYARIAGSPYYQRPPDERMAAAALFTIIAGSAEATAVSLDALTAFFTRKYGTRPGATSSILSTLDTNNDGLVSRKEWADGFTTGIMEAMGIVFDDPLAVSPFFTVSTVRRRTIETVQRPPRRCTVRASGSTARVARVLEEVEE